jgi:predicted unusual protein kinase regulating ubiquinone biosynthesis (AarF/ABC1/UbiB family)
MIAFLLEEFRDKPIDVRAFEQISNEIYLMFEQQPFRLPPQMTFIIKSLTTLDGIARALDPQYNLLAAAQPFVKNIAFSQQQGSIIKTLAKQTKDLIVQKINQPSRTELLISRLESRLEMGELQVRVRSLESERALKRIQQGIKSLIYACLTGFTLLSATILLVGSYPKWAIVLFSLAGFWVLMLLRSLISLALKERLDKMTQK